MTILKGGGAWFEIFEIKSEKKGGGIMKTFDKLCIVTDLVLFLMAIFNRFLSQGDLWFKNAFLVLTAISLLLSVGSKFVKQKKEKISKKETK
jgi:hypothetical protein